jgi:peroxiredoxin
VFGRLTIAVAAAALTASAGDPKIPRKSPELVVATHGGGQLRLSEYRGKVVLLEVLLTTCPHCQHSAQMLNRMQAEYGPRGFQAIGVAFTETDQNQIENFIRTFGVKYPVGYVPRETIYKYLGADAATGIHVPNLVFIDHQGIIRHHSLLQGDSETAREDNVRVRLQDLLKEQARPATARKPRPSLIPTALSVTTRAVPRSASTIPGT